MFYVPDAKGDLVNIANFDGISIMKINVVDKEEKEKTEEEKKKDDNLFAVAAWWRSTTDPKKIQTRPLFTGTEKDCRTYRQSIWDLIQGKKKRVKE